ncbi:MAG: stage II sporulation protein M [Blastocatellia bacterium]|nr:stage II sporulation protein M [Blastocatellia bacterium]
MNRFINENKDNWQRLEDLLGLARGNGLRGLEKLEVREFGELYRRAAADLAIARVETRDPKVINYLNSLVVRAHGKIYRADGDGSSLIKKYFAHDLPQAARDTWVFSFSSFLLMIAVGTAAFLLCYHDPEFANLSGLGPVEGMATSNTQWWMSLNDANQIGASSILTNNIQVTFLAFALGAFFGIGTIYVLIVNALHIGGVLGVSYRVNPAFGNELVTFMVAHGVVELTCIFLAAGAGLAIGYSIMVPGDLSRSQAVKKSGITAVRVVIGCAILLFFAGVIEGFLSPSAFPAWIKLATGLVTGLLLLGYLRYAGRNAEPAIEAAAAR